MPFIETSDVIKIIEEQKEKNITSLISNYYQKLNSNNTRFFYNSNNQNDDKLLPVLCSLFHDRNLTIEKILFENNDFTNIDKINLRRIYHSINDADIDHELEQERHKDTSNSFLDKNELKTYRNKNVLNIYTEIFKDNDTSSYIKEYNYDFDLNIQSDSKNFLILYNDNNGINIPFNIKKSIDSNYRNDIKLNWTDESCYIDSALVSIFHDGYQTFEEILSNINNTDDQEEYKKIFKIYELDGNNDVDVNLFNIIKQLRSALLNIYKYIKEGFSDTFYVTILRTLLDDYNKKIQQLYSNDPNFNDYNYDDPNFNLLNTSGDVKIMTDFIFNRILKNDIIKFKIFSKETIMSIIGILNNLDNNIDKIVYQLLDPDDINLLPLNLENGLILSSFIIHKNKNHFISYINYKNKWYEYDDNRNNDSKNSNLLVLINLDNYNNNILEYINNKKSDDYTLIQVIYSRDNYKHLPQTTNMDIKLSSIVCIDKDEDEKTVCLYKNNEKWYKYDCQKYTSYDIEETDNVKEAEISNYKSPYYLIYK